MTTLALFLEEASAKALIEALLPRIVSAERVVCPRYFVYRGKQDMLKHIHKDLRLFRGSDTPRLVLVDQDHADCMILKGLLRQKSEDVGVSCVIRIACRELESWYLAQLDVVEQVYAVKNLSAQQNKSKYRNPDILTTPDCILQKLTHMRYSKIDGSRRMGALLDINNSRSSSCMHFMVALRKVLEGSHVSH